MEWRWVLRAFVSRVWVELWDSPEKLGKLVGHLRQVGALFYFWLRLVRVVRRDKRRVLRRNCLLNASTEEKSLAARLAHCAHRTLESIHHEIVNQKALLFTFQVQNCF